MRRPGRGQGAWSTPLPPRQPRPGAQSSPFPAFGVGPPSRGPTFCQSPPPGPSAGRSADDLGPAPLLAGALLAQLPPPPGRSIARAGLHPTAQRLGARPPAPRRSGPSCWHPSLFEGPDPPLGPPEDPRRVRSPEGGVGVRVGGAPRTPPRVRAQPGQPRLPGLGERPGRTDSSWAAVVARPSAPPARVAGPVCAALAAGSAGWIRGRGRGVGAWPPRPPLSFPPLDSPPLCPAGRAGPPPGCCPRRTESLQGRDGGSGPGFCLPPGAGLAGNVRAARGRRLGPSRRQPLPSCSLHGVGALGLIILHLGPPYRSPEGLGASRRRDSEPLEAWLVWWRVGSCAHLQFCKRGLLALSPSPLLLSTHCGPDPATL